MIWNVKSGEVKNVLRHNDKPVSEMTWLDGRVENSGHLLAALHPPFALVLWDASNGDVVWKKTYAETLQGFDFDPFDASRLAFRCIEWVLFIDDFHPKKAPSRPGKKYYILGPPRGSPQRDDLDEKDKTKMAKARIRKLMKGLVVGEASSKHQEAEDALTLSDCVQVVHHKAVRNHLLLVYPREVLVLDLDIGQTVGVITLDRSSPSIVGVFSGSQRDVIYLLNECGTVSVRRRKRLFGAMSASVAPTPLTKSTSTYSVGNDSVDSINFNTALEINYEQIASGESVRLSKSAKVMGMTVNPMTEKDVAVFTTDGKIIFQRLVKQHDKKDVLTLTLEDLMPSVMSFDKESPLHFHTSGILSGLPAPPFIIRMCPALTLKNIAEYTPLMAIGAPNGNVHVVNMSTGCTEREFAVHTFPVRGLEWAGLHSIMSHAHQPMSQSSDGASSSSSSSSSTLVRNELVHTDVRTGRTKTLRPNRAEEPPIEMLRVSHLKQYFIIAFAAGQPFELWDLKTLSLLRTMPKKFPPVTALDWSPLHNLKSLRKRMNAANPDGTGSGISPSPDGANVPLVAKEHFVFTDPEGQLYHFSVEGNAIRDGTKLPAEPGLSHITCIAWKSDHIVRGDVDGNVNVWDVRTRSSRNISTNRGPVKKMRFAPGRGNFKLVILHPQSVAVWDMKECELVSELRTPKELAKVIDIDWAASDRVVLASVDGCLRIMGLSLASSTSPMLEYNAESTVACLPLLPNKARNNFNALLHHQPWKDDYTLDFNSDDGFANSELSFVKEQIATFPRGARRFLERKCQPKDLVERFLVASQLCGLAFEADFWRATRSVLFNDRPLDNNFDLVCDNESYLRYNLERSHLHETRSSSGGVARRRVIDFMLCLGQKDEAVRLLLETEPENPNYYEDNLRACLVTMTGVAERDTPHSTTKLVATNLIAEGKLWEGVQLLCLIDKAADACKYLQSSGEWDASLWLAKCRLKGADLESVAEKYCEHYALSNGLAQKKRAVLVRLSMKNFVSVLDTLVSAKMIMLAAQFLDLCAAAKLLPDSSHVMVLSEEINLAYARFLFDAGNPKAAFFYCDKADEKGEILRREFELLLSNASNDDDK